MNNACSMCHNKIENDRTNEILCRQCEIKWESKYRTIFGDKIKNIVMNYTKEKK